MTKRKEVSTLRQDIAEGQNWAWEPGQFPLPRLECNLFACLRLSENSAEPADWESLARCVLQAYLGNWGCIIAQERRHWQRLRLAIPVFLRGCDKSGNQFLDFTTALNVSAGGALIAARRALPRSSSISLEIPTSPLPRVADCPGAVRCLKARVVRADSREAYNLYALRFTHPLL